MRRMERRIQLEQVLPEKIEDRSFEIISEELMERFQTQDVQARGRASDQAGDPHNRRF